MTDPFTFDPNRVLKETEYEGGQRWHRFSCALPNGNILTCKGEDSQAVMEGLERRFNKHAAKYSAHHKMMVIVAAQEGVE